MAASKRTAAQREIDLERLADMYCRGLTQRAMALALNVDRKQVFYDLQKLRKLWLDSALAKFDERKAAELARIDHLEAVAWAAWERSCQPEETLKASSTRGRVNKDGAALPNLERSEKTSKGQVGDPRFMDMVKWCIQKRCEIAGLLDQPGTGAATIVTVVGGIDMDVILGRKAGLPHEQIGAGRN